MPTAIRPFLFWRPASWAGASHRYLVIASRPSPCCTHPDQNRDNPIKNTYTTLQPDQNRDNPIKNTYTTLQPDQNRDNPIKNTYTTLQPDQNRDNPKHIENITTRSEVVMFSMCFCLFLLWCFLYVDIMALSAHAIVKGK